MIGAPAAPALLEDSLQEERAMADWLHEHLKPTVMRYVEPSGAGQPAAH